MDGSPGYGVETQPFFKNRVDIWQGGDVWVRLSQAVDELPIHQDLFSLKLFFINDPTDPRIRQLIDEQTALLQQSLAHLRQRQRTVFSDDRAITRHYGHYLILARAISRTRGQLVWLKTVADNLK